MPTKQTALVETLPYAAAQTRSLALPRNGSIHHLDLRLQIQYDVTNGDPGYDEDFLAKLISSLAIRDGQGHTWWACGDGRQLYWWAYQLYQGQVRMDTLATGVNNNLLAEAFFPIHFGVNPLNPFDPTAGIPALDLGQLALEVTWRDAENLVTTAANFAVDSATITVTPAELTGREYQAVRPTMLRPMTRWEKYDIAAAQGELGVRRELPAGIILRQTSLLVLDGDDSRMDYIAGDRDVTEVGLVKVLENTVPFREAWQTLRGRNQGRYGLPAMTNWEGVALVNWGQLAGDVAMDLRTRLPGQDVIGFTTVDTGGDIYLLHHALAPS
ncbi:hypothetical protein LCGC14_1288910 [marine sediment metagenome]|uniref:Uncharacterized protein n=1 Tax=marine sediment metagenome TaxID=412755 RepID=A0A0F9LE16_9ZZZZ